VDLRNSKADVYRAGATALRPRACPTQGLCVDLGCSIAPREREPQRLQGMQEVAQGDVRGGLKRCKRQLLAANLLQSQMKDKRKRKKRASLTSLLPFPSFF